MRQREYQIIKCDSVTGEGSDFESCDCDLIKANKTIVSVLVQQRPLTAFPTICETEAFRMLVSSLRVKFRIFTFEIYEMRGFYSQVNKHFHMEGDSYVRFSCLKHHDVANSEHFKFGSEQNIAIAVGYNTLLL